ncbi:MAG: hypothetical protein SOV79_09215 [Eisenbergiella porci]|uniref:hypothetical protein n=1 Tax=Eisenbergiella porci TaxID=2652274 RepID=UPI002A75CE92|nr:hypothetical protein [Eisenbergiella porci]MDY2652754.1 hypothetical protein [Eisenbergiella porci]
MAIKSVQVIINGVTTDLTLNSSTGEYEKTLTAPNKSSWNNNSGHYYPINVKATDSAGNIATKNDVDTNLGKLDVNETVAPVSTITSPTEGQLLINAKPTVTWKVTDNDSGVNPDTISIIIDSGSKITSGIVKTAITGGYQCSYAIASALSDGNHVIKVDAKDYDGNAAVQRLVNIVIDITPPQLNVPTPVNNLVTKNPVIPIEGNTDDVTSKPCTVTVKCNDSDAKAIDVASNGAFSSSVTYTDGIKEGTNVIRITSTDRAGKSTYMDRTVILDTVAPVIGAVKLSKNPVGTGDTFKISVTVTDA